MEEYFVGWGSLALLNAAIASASGRGPLKNFLGSLMLGPLITIILAGTVEDENGDLRQVDLWKGGRIQR